MIRATDLLRRVGVVAAAEPASEYNPIPDFKRICDTLISKGAEKAGVTTGRKIGRLPLFVRVDVTTRPEIVFYVNSANEHVSFSADPRVEDPRYCIRRDLWRRSPRLNQAGPAGEFKDGKTMLVALLDDAEKTITVLRKKQMP